MKKYKPNTAISAYEFLKRFPNEETANEYLEKEHSSNIQGWSKKGWYRCCSCDCRNPFNVRTGTIFANSKIPLSISYIFLITGGILWL